jgi:hypothetical protein
MYQLIQERKTMTKLNKLNSHQAHYFLASMIISSSLNNRFINEEETEKQYYLKNNIDSLKFLSSEQKRILKNQESKKTLSLKSAKSVKEAFNKIRKALETTEISVENMTIKTIISYEANDKIPVDGIKNKSFEAIFNKNFKMYVKPVFNTLPYAEREKTSVTKIDVLPAESTKL